MRHPSAPVLIKIEELARQMALEWVRDQKGLREKCGEQEFAYRMFRAAARKGREIERKFSKREPAE